MLGHPVKMNLIVHSVFELESGNRNVEGQTNGQKTDKQTDRITPISKGTCGSCDGDLCPCQA